MGIENIKERIKGLIAEKFKVDDNIKDTAFLVDYGLGVDSVSTLEFVVALEKEFGVEIDESEINPVILKDINSVADYIAGKSV